MNPLKRYSFIVVLALLISFSGTAWSCQGQHLQQAKQIIDSAWRAGIDIGLTQDFNKQLQTLFQISNQLNYQTQHLPPSCRALVQRWSNAIGQSFSGQQYNGCMGGVCCDNSGCY